MPMASAGANLPIVATLPIDASIPIDPAMVLCLGGMDGTGQDAGQNDGSGGPSKAIGHDACCLASCLHAFGGFLPPPALQFAYFPAALGSLTLAAISAPASRRYSSSAQPRAPPQTA